MNQKKIVTNNYDRLCTSPSYYSDWNIQFINKYSIKNNLMVAPGGSLPMIDIDNIYSVYKNRIEEGEFSILFIDNSIAFLEYTFDENNITKHRLTFITPDESMSIQYFRIDYDPQIYNGPNHPEVHISLLDNRQRISINRPILPKQFVYIINKFIFNNQTVKTDKLLSENLDEIESNAIDQKLFIKI